ncbi:carbohydrate porin [Brevundimonas sp. 2YAF1]|uniref:carbohydrate porin n=1 Tax=Brevundimonas sp. 2YAF1 TaxID=3233024 RepID=UPI003F90FF2C
MARAGFVVVAWLMAAPATALAAGQDKPLEQADTQSAPPPSAPRTELTGDWGGLRSRWLDRGVRINARLSSESAANLSGGTRRTFAEAGQFDVGARLDMEKLFGLKGGSFQATAVYRYGDNLVTRADLGVILQPQEIFGRGETWRLTQFWYEQEFAGGRAALKVGRIPESDDFGGFSCYFQNLSFCGSVPGRVAGSYWFNWPISQWAARLRVKDGDRYAQVGVYQVNPKDLKNAFTIGYFNGATGVVVPVEVGWTPKLGSEGLPGNYRVGAWYSSVDGDDVLLDVNRQPRVLTGDAPLRRDGRYGGYVLLQQQVTGSASDGTPYRGLILFLNLVQADAQTSTVEQHLAGGLFYKGPFASHPEDAIGFGVGRSHINDRVAEGQRLDPAGPPVQHSEYAAELYYSLHPSPWLVLRPNIQYYHDPGGVDGRKDVTVAGLKASVTF